MFTSYNYHPLYNVYLYADPSAQRQIPSLQNSDRRIPRIIYGSVCRRKERLASTGRDAADLRFNSPPTSTPLGTQQKKTKKRQQGGSTQSQDTPRQSLVPSTLDSLKATNVLPHGYFTASALMKSLGGTIFPTTTATTQEGIDYDDEDEDSPASTIVPPSPVGSRRNSLMNNGATTEETEDIITSSGDHLSSSVAYGEYDIDGDDILTPVNGLHPRPQSHTSHPRPLPSHPKLARENPRPAAPGITGVHEQRANHQRNLNSHGTIPATTTRGGLFEKVETKPSRPLQSSVAATQTPRMEDRAQAPTPTETSAATPTVSASKLHPRVAVILGVDRKWYLPLVVCRAMSVGPALWWGLRCAFTFLAELLRIRPGSMWREGWVAIVVSSAAADWDVERRFRVTEVALAIVWVCTLPPSLSLSQW